MNEYYVKQAGSGIGGFSGSRYQKGDGFFGRFVSGSILPLLKKVLPYLGKTALSAGADILGDVSQGQKLGESFKNRMNETGQKITDKSMSKVRELVGGGPKKKRRRREQKAKAPKVTSKRRAKGRKKTTKSKRAKDFL